MKTIALLLATAALTLTAQDATLGAKAHLILPMGDLRDLANGQIGVGIAGFVSFPLEGGIILRPLIGFQHIPKATSVGLSDTKTTIASVDLMVEGLWFPGADPDHGPYLIAAAGLQQWRLSNSGSGSSTLSATHLGLSGGLGYQFHPSLGFEARGFWSPVTPTLRATGLTVGATFQF